MASSHAIMLHGDTQTSLAVRHAVLETVAFSSGSDVTTQLA